MLNRFARDTRRMVVVAAVTVLAASALGAAATATAELASEQPSSSAVAAVATPQAPVKNARSSRVLELTEEGTVLDGARVRGRIVVKADRVKIKNSRVRGSIVVKADTVRIKNSKVTSRGRQGIRVSRDTAGTRILKSAVVCKAPRTNGIAPGNYVARRVRVNGCNKAFVFSRQNPAKVRKSWIDGKPYSNGVKTLLPPPPTPTATPTPTPTATPTVPVYEGWPTPDTTGPREPATQTTGSLRSSAAGQVISRVTVNGRLTVAHDNVTVRDVTVNGDNTYMIQVVEKEDGTCPVNVRFEYVEIDGSAAEEDDIPLFSPDCGYVFDHGHVHNVGRASRLIDNTTISNSYVIADRDGTSGSHRGAVGTNGGSNNALINNVLLCSSDRGCSAAIPMYGDFAPVDGMLVQHNLMATTGGYCAYGGSLPSKPYPHGSNIRFIDNHFSTRFEDRCGMYGPIAHFDDGVRGNEWRGNVWHESGRTVPAPG